MLGERSVVVPRGAGQRAHDAAGKDHERVADGFQLGRGHGRRLAALDHVGHQRHRRAERRDDAGEIVARFRRLDEQHVGAGLAIHRGALDRAVEALDRHRVGARDDQRLARAARIDRGADLAAHLLRRDQRLAVEMAAALGEVLVLELDRGGAGALELADGAMDVQRVAVAGVGVDDQVRGHAVADQRQRLGHLGHGDEPDVRPAEPRVGDGGAGDVERLEAGLRRDQRGERVIDARRHHDGLLGEAGAQGWRVRHCHIPR